MADYLVVQIKEKVGLDWADELSAVLQDSTGLPVRVADNPMSCVALGAGRTLEDTVYRGAIVAA